MTPAEPVPGESRKSRSNTSTRADVVCLAHCIQGLFDLLAKSATSDPVDLQVQLGEFRDEFYPKLELIMRRHRSTGDGK